MTVTLNIEGFVITVGKHGSNKQAWQLEQEASTDILNLNHKVA